MTTPMKTNGLKYKYFHCVGVRFLQQLTYRQPAQNGVLTDQLALSGHLLYSFVNHTYANRYPHHLVQ